MIDNKTKLEKKKDQGLNSVAAGLAGAVVGVGLAIGAAQVLKNDNVKEKAKHIMDNVKDHAKEYLDKTDMDEKISKAVKKASKKASKKANKVVDIKVAGKTSKK